MYVYIYGEGGFLIQSRFNIEYKTTAADSILAAYKLVRRKLLISVVQKNIINFRIIHVTIDVEQVYSVIALSTPYFHHISSIFYVLLDFNG